MTGSQHGWIAVVAGLGSGVAVLENTATKRISYPGEQLTQVAFGLDIKPPPAKRAIEIDARTLNSQAGRYRLAPNFILDLTVEGCKWLVRATGQDKVQIYPESKTKFFYSVVNAQITVVPGKGGKVKKLILHQNERNMECPRE